MNNFIKFFLSSFPYLHKQKSFNFLIPGSCLYCIELFQNLDRFWHVFTFPIWFIAFEIWYLFWTSSCNNKKVWCRCKQKSTWKSFPNTSLKWNGIRMNHTVWDHSVIGLWVECWAQRPTQDHIFILNLKILLKFIMKIKIG